MTNLFTHIDKCLLKWIWFNTNRCYKCIDANPFLVQSVTKIWDDLVVTNKGNHLLITLCLVCSTIMVKFYEKLWLLKKITNYWHLKFFLLIAPKRGWHLCIIGDSSHIYYQTWMQNVQIKGYCLVAGGYYLIWFDFWCLTSLSAIFQLYHGGQF
jgi:hypothetical protein